MSNNAYPLRTNEKEEFVTRARITGAAAADPTATLAHGIAFTYLAATGKFRATFATPPGKTFTGAAFAFQATTPSDLAGYTVVFSDYVAPTSTARGYIDFWIYNSTFALANLTSTQKLNLEFTFRRTGNTAP